MQAFALLPGLVGQALHRVLQLQRQALGLTLAGIGQQHHETIARQAAQQVLAAQVEQQHVADRL